MKRSSKFTASRVKVALQALRVIALTSLAAAVVVAQSSVSTRPDVPSLKQQHRVEDSQNAVKLATVLVSVPVTVTDRSGRAISGLKKENFRVYEDRVEQPIRFFSDEDSPASIGVVFDVSGSMRDAKIIQAREALSRLIRTSHEQDEYFVVSFNSTPHLLLAGTRNAEAVLNQFENVYPSGETALYDAVNLGIQQVSHGAYPKRALILISDGEDNHSRCSLKELRRSVQESDVAIYTLRIGGITQRQTMARAVMDSVAQMTMDNLASITGGRAFWPWNSREMDEAFERIAWELRHQYSIGYIPSNYVADGKLHRIKVALTVPGNLSSMVVRNREGYYAVEKTDSYQNHSARRY